MNKKNDSKEDFAKPKKSWKNRIDNSILIAVAALLISVIGTLTGIYEARILRGQQSIMQHQSAAAVWPYLERVLYTEFREDGRLELIYNLSNKGVGPAIMVNFNYTMGGEPAKLDSIINKLNELSPRHLHFEATQRLNLDYHVFSPGENKRLFTISASNIETGAPVRLNDIAHLEKLGLSSSYCYCSVYDECYRYNSETSRPTRAELCEGS